MVGIGKRRRGQSARRGFPGLPQPMSHQPLTDLPGVGFWVETRMLGGERGVRVVAVEKTFWTNRRASPVVQALACGTSLPLWGKRTICGDKAPYAKGRVVMNNPFLIGPTLYLRPLEKTDAALVMSWLNDPEVNRTLQTCFPINLLVEEAFIARVSQGDHSLPLVMVLRESDKPIGVTGLHEIDYRNRHAGFGITIGAKEAWGKGYGAEATRLLVQHAFATLNLNRVWLRVYEYNTRGQRAYEKVGFKKEGLLRQDNFREGRYWNTIIMSLLREEWDGDKGRSEP
jgi:RimJ/RimL family protein N-acetyltransferase